MNIGSRELYINMKPRDIPFWNPLYSFEEQDKDVQDFWANETMKLMNGVTINGVYIHPWLYWHLNFWKIMSDIGDNTRVPVTPDLRDNEWFFTENLIRAEEENKGIFMFGTRRFGKALLNSEVVYLKDREKRICDVLVGDMVYGDDGKLTEVTGVYPQGRVRTYKVTFEDGRNVVCCGEHLWTVSKNGTSWSCKPLKEIMMMPNYKEYSIPLTEQVEYESMRVPIHPSAYGSMIANCLLGYSDSIPLEIGLTRPFLRSHPSLKKDFVESFIKGMQGVVTGEEKIFIPNYNRPVVKFLLRMLWSYGLYAKYEDGYLYISFGKHSVGIKNIEIYGTYEATCITVSNKSSLFLTTNYIVTHNSAIMASLLARNATLTYNLDHNVVCASADDLGSLTRYLEFGLDNMPPFLKIGRTSNNWSKGVTLGVKTVSNERDIHAQIQITNVEGGKGSAALKTAGGTPYTTIYDEVGKFPFLDAYLAGLPAHMYKGKMRGMILAAGCCCAGTMVMKKDGKLVPIEDLEEKDGIIGYNVRYGRCEKQTISSFNPPAMKHCTKITFYCQGKRIILRCSWDHPIYCFNPEGRDKVYFNYVPAALLQVGDTVGYIDKQERLLKAFVEDIEDIGLHPVYNLTASETHTYIANGILTHNTGGNVEMSQDAQKVMNDPAAYGFITMDYNLLNRHVEHPTWRKGKSGIFVPGQMSYAFQKKDTTLDKYLGREGDLGLKKIKISVTDFEASTAQIKSELDALAKGDKKIFLQKRMAYPLTPDDCFLQTHVNRFPVEDALIHKNRLLEEGRSGKQVDIFQMDGKRMGWNFSEKVLAGFPFEGGNIDSPVVIYEDPPEEGGIFDYTYTCGLDIYKSDKADTTSLGAFYIYKRHVGINDVFGNKIVASYASRPASSDDFCRTCEVLQEAYGAVCLMENADRMYEMYLARRNKEVVLLADGEQVASRVIRPNAKQNNRLGLTPTVANQRMLYNTLLQYCWEDVVIGYDEDGNEITQRGIYRIDDIELLEEIIAFGPGVNTDRIIAFGHALLLAKYYDDMNYWPESPTQKMNRKMRKDRMFKERIINGISLRRHSPFRM